MSLIGTLIAGKYRVDSLIGSGSTGDVYLCRHTGLDKIVALKLLHRDMVKHANFVERFKREARAASRLEHPNSVRVLDFGEDPDGVLYIVMEYIAGRDLWSVLDEEWPLDNARIVDILSQVLGALGTAHNLGIVHRDLKPENIMVRREQRDEGEKDLVTVCDFGIAQLSPMQLAGSFSPLSPVVTGDGMVVGTPAYMSPEQARAEQLDARSDVYSAGVVLFQMLTRQLPFTAETPLAVAVLHCSEPPPSPSQLALVHPRLESVCLRALSKPKEDRYQSAREMLVALQAALNATVLPHPSLRKRRRKYLPLSEPPVVQKPLPKSPSSLAPVERERPSDEPPPAAEAARRNRLSNGVRFAVVAALIISGAITIGSVRQAGPDRAGPGAGAGVNRDGRDARDARRPAAAVQVVQPVKPVIQTPDDLGLPTRPARPEREDRHDNDGTLQAGTELLAAAETQGAPSTPSPQLSPLAQTSTEPLPAVAIEAPGPAKAARAAANAGLTQPQPRRARDKDKPGGGDKANALPPAAPPAPVHASQNGHDSRDANDASDAAVEPPKPESEAVVASEPERKPEPGAALREPYATSDLQPHGPTPAQLSMLPSAPPRPSASTPQPKAATVNGGGGMPTFERASVTIGEIDIQSAVSKASIRSALNQASLTRCYRDSLVAGAIEPKAGSAAIGLSTNMSGRIASANVTTAGLPRSLQQCFEAVARAGRVREVDTGVARATITLQLRP